MIQSARASMALLEPAEWPSLSVLLVVHIATALLDTTGAGVVFVFFRVAMDMENFGGIGQVQWIYEYLGLEHRTLFMGLLTLVVLLVFLFRATLQIWSAWLGLAVRRRIHRRVAARLFNGYMRDAYIMHLRKSSSVIMNNVTANTSGAVAHCTIGLVEILSAALLMLFFVAGLFYVKPLETFVTCIVLGSISAAYWFLMQDRVSRWGRSMLKAVQETYRMVSEAFQGFKTIKVLGAEKYFMDAFSQFIGEQTHLTLKSGFAAQVPRLGIEIILVTGILGLVAAAFFIGQSAAEVVPTLALFGVAALRITPAFARVVTALQLYKGAAPFRDAILDDYRRFARFDTESASAITVSSDRGLGIGVVLESVSFSYDAQSGFAVENVSLEIRKGQFVGFAGRSGSGKTTTADLILGLLQPTKGRLLVDGRARTGGASDFHGLFAYVPQEPFIIDDSLLRNIALGVKEEEIDPARLARAVQLSSLTPVVDKLPQGLDTLLGERGSRLSGGERQRLGLARALYCDADILVLDEPTSALDATTEAEVSRVIDTLRGEKTIILIAHRLSTIVRCDQLFFFDDGRLVGSGDFEKLMASTPGFRDMVEHLKIQTVSMPVTEAVRG